MKTKKCTKCGKIKKLTEFFKCKRNKDGIQYMCRACKNEYQKSYRQRNKALLKDRRKKYLRTKKGLHIKNMANKRYRSSNPLKDSAHRAVAYALNCGEIIKRGCECCGEKAQAHHPDYSKPLDVVWLCDKHHKVWHKKNKIMEKIKPLDK